MNNQSSYLQLLQYFPVGDAKKYRTTPAYKPPHPKRSQQVPCELEHLSTPIAHPSHTNALPERTILRDVAYERYSENYRLLHNVFYPQDSSGIVLDLEDGVFTQLLKGDENDEDTVQRLMSRIEQLSQ